MPNVEANTSENASPTKSGTVDFVLAYPESLLVAQNESIVSKKHSS